MKCPVCTSVDLLMTDRQGVEIDYCPQCRGIWLDRGELDKLIERSASIMPAQPSQAPMQPVQAREYYDHDDHKKHGHDDHHSGDHGYKKRKSWLSEIMDIG
jgi:uncharacterized protein